MLLEYCHPFPPALYITHKAPPPPKEPGLACFGATQTELRPDVSKHPVAVVIDTIARLNGNDGNELR
jgi:hypothetical protein